MRVGARRIRAVQLRRTVAESEIALWCVQQNHGPRQQKLLGCRVHDALKRDRVERLEICCCLRRPANGARHSNHNALFSRCHDSLLGKTRTWLLRRDPRHDREHKGIPVIEAMQTRYARREFF